MVKNKKYRESSIADDAYSNVISSSSLISDTPRSSESLCSWANHAENKHKLRGPKLSVVRHIRRLATRRKSQRLIAELNNTGTPSSVSSVTCLDGENAIMEGWVNKWTNMLNTWKPRYFQLYPGYICYDKGTKKKKKKRFLLSFNLCHLEISTKDSLRITIKFFQNPLNPLHMRAFSLESKLIWLNALLYCMNPNIPNPPQRTIDSPLSSSCILPSASYDCEPLLSNLLYELMKARNKLLDDVTNNKERNKNLHECISSTFDRFIGLVFDMIYQKLRFHKSRENDLYDALLQSFKTAHNLNALVESSPVNETSEETDTFYDALSDISNLDVYITQSFKLTSIPSIHICHTCYWYINPFKYRKSLPCQQIIPRFNLWASIKDSITKDISRITIPIQFNEPTSLLQRLAENFEYSNILEGASRKLTGIERLLDVTIFSLTPYASSVGRLYKPFNPLLGETYEFSHRGFRYFAEQVGHHPPVTAYYVEHHHTLDVAEGTCSAASHPNTPLYRVWGHISDKSRFTGQSLEISVLGNVNITFSGRNDYYTYNRPRLLVHNILLGRLWIEFIGISTIINHSTCEYSIIEYKKSGWFGSDLNSIRGIIFNNKHIPIYKIGGRWDGQIWFEVCQLPQSQFTDDSSHVGAHLEFNSVHKPLTLGLDSYIEKGDMSSEHNRKIPFKPPSTSYCLLNNWEKLKTKENSRSLIWSPKIKSNSSERYFGFSDISFELNEISPQYDKSYPGVLIPNTDSRFRPDQRAYENGNIDWAIKEKRRLEEKQRIAAKMRKSGESDYIPKWFYKDFDPVTGESTWNFNKKYWHHKDNLIEFTDIPDIF
ncbi:oxysterol-binding protein, putative [Cryptosporidium muris RN66]|uniref:Oxysterol-binding protein, putative n=1 Tax=Cryptosporidium muris (strain RN66) TaxID=441375 RepID=B6AD06_CRYMR|nr:oxysterol-binding protein, putative [Cryptosporidium muris RN66]EEA06010.1 oxysterol-binding protein, putative [Cryptosporidium muris RN66]|eukprot:XP_002140359.1 oxysterol-binding protein [Cryptosporidium muris RN66]